MLRRLFQEDINCYVRHLFRGNGAELAKFVGCTPTSAYNWRNGGATPRIDQLLRLSDRLRIPVGAFLKAEPSGGAVAWRVVCCHLKHIFAGLKHKAAATTSRSALFP
jgi:transcriptional regulator with XRE-family HTH domain